MEQEIVEKVMKEVLEDLKIQRSQVTQLFQLIDQQKEAIQKLEEIVASAPIPANKLSEEQVAIIKTFIKENFEALQAAVESHPVSYTTNHHHSVFPVSFRMEHFPLLIDTVMKWVVIMIVLIFAIWLIGGMVNR